MRTLISAALLAALFTPAITGLAAAADLDYYEPRPAPVLLPPPPPPCGIYRPCLRPYARFGDVLPRPRRFGWAPPPYHFGYPSRPYVEERFGYGRPHGDAYEPRGEAHRYDSRERYGTRDRFEPEERGYGRPHGERYGYDRRDDERFERGPGPGPDVRGDRDPYDRG